MRRDDGLSDVSEHTAWLHPQAPQNNARNQNTANKTRTTQWINLNKINNKKKTAGAGKKNKRKNQKEFDSTLGYPGEGPERLRMATFNVRGLKGKDDDGIMTQIK